MNSFVSEILAFDWKMARTKQTARKSTKSSKEAVGYQSRT